jgi:hypothetical protein
MMEAVGELKGTRLALASESDGSKRFNETVLKRLTGGDTLRGTKLQQTAFEFKPEFKIWMLANHLPFARDGSHGFWRRIKIVPLRVSSRHRRSTQHFHISLRLKPRGCCGGWSKVLSRGTGASLRHKSRPVWVLVPPSTL